MTLPELKEKIKPGMEDLFIVFQLTDLTSEYIAWKYIYSISEVKGLSVIRIDSTNEIDDGGLLEDKNLYVLKCDNMVDVEPVNNLVVLCSKTSYKEAIKLPKLEPWQFIDYINKRVPGLNKTDIEWLTTIYNQTDSRVTTINYNRLENDLDKLSVFPESVQNNLFNYLYDHGEYDTISSFTIFDLTGALIKKDREKVLQVLKVIDYIDAKPHVWLLSILLNNFRNIIAIQTGQGVTAESLGIKDKQYWVIKKYNIGYYDLPRLIKIYEMLTGLEYKYKFGGLNMDQMSDYIICKILTV